MTFSFKILSVVFFSIILTACGGGSGGSSSPTINATSINADSEYTGVRNKAVLTRDNSLSFVDAIIGRNIENNLIQSTDSAARPISTLDAQRTVNGLSSLTQARNINESGACSQGGNISISGELNNDNIGQISLAINNCTEDSLTINGTINMNITKYDSINDEPTEYMISFNNLSIVFGEETYSAIGTQLYTRDDDFIATTITNMIQTDNSSKGTLFTGFTTKTTGLFTEFSGKVFLEDHGYVDVTTPEPTRINNGTLTFVGEIILSGASSSKAKISPDYNEETFIDRLRVDLDQNGDDIYEYLSVQDETTDGNNLGSFTENNPPVLLTEAELILPFNSNEERNIDQLWINDRVIIRAFAYDPEGYDVSYIWTLESSPIGNTFEIPSFGFTVEDISQSISSNTEGFSSGLGMDFRPNVSGEYEFSVKVTDADGFSSTEFINLSVQENQPPTAVIVDEDGINLLGSNNSINLSGQNSSDIENSDLSYFWEIISQPTNSNIDISEIKSFNTLTITPNASGTYVFSLQVTDSQGATHIDTINIDVPQNQAPTAVIENVSSNYTVGRTVVIYGWVQSTDGEGGGNLNYNWTLISKPPTSTIDLVNSTEGSSGFFPDVAGNYNIELTVTDFYGLSDTTSVVINISNRSN